MSKPEGYMTLACAVRALDKNVAARSIWREGWKGRRLVLNREHNFLTHIQAITGVWIETPWIPTEEDEAALDWEIDGPEVEP